MKNFQSLDEFGIFGEQKGFWYGWNKMEENAGGDNVGEINRCQITEGF